MVAQRDVLVEVAETAGIKERYIDNWGKEAHIASESLAFMLNELGYDTSSDDSLLQSKTKHVKEDVLEPVVFGRENEAIEVALHIADSARESDFEWTLTTEDGQYFSGYIQSDIIRDERQSGGALFFSVPALPLGYHSLTVSRKRRKSPYTTTIIVTPCACYKQPEIANGKKLWGPSIQLYTLKTEHNWGMGDFGDLKHLVAEMAQMGADFVGLNPIHALFPANPEGASPYSPSSRRWLNIFYIDVSSIPEFALSSTAQQIVGSGEFQTKLEKVRESHWVNYTEVAALKMSVLPLLFQEFKKRHLTTGTARAKDFTSFVTAGGESLLAQATFDALQSKLSEDGDNIWGWQAFPEKYQQFQNPAVQKYIDENADEVNLYLYLQWIADTQIEEVQQLALERGMVIGLYRDLAVGVAESGSEAWADQGNLMLNLSVGAPPDNLGPLGQNWGLPPINPEVMRNNAYSPFIRLLKANMKHCGTLRIDHVMGLLRLWWVPRGVSATKGAYMRYPVHELLSILALESHRNQCSVIGEDLGTVPVEMEQLLADAGVHSYKVFFFETADDGGFISPRHYVGQSMSALCTHDMPTLRGFWHCNDLKMGKELGLYPDEEQLQRLFDQRLHAKQNILDSVAWHGFLPDGVGRDASLVPMDTYLSEGLHLHLAAGASSLMSIQLEDWLEMDNPVNIPGTVDEYPNWRRKLSSTLEAIFSRDDIKALAQHITQVRQNTND
ncbi:4-alpha-glucanotransferase [Vibrio viridaestus]|uniref:4-alpha-glucanotransferase n=1 Tax=Vibrio viridaestus TaxID=2487322 RepID=A0A3N9TMF1_9VIBR|nr:4-alpha-glucanotransferase [Vibrio viridaestus]RQW65023.1 4-alpha-glucanotransferase [Vibrio viridaestus]